METTPSGCRRRSVQQLLFIIAGSHTGGFLGSALTRFGSPGAAFGGLLVAFRLDLPVVVDAY